MKCSDVMTKNPVCCRETDSVTTAAQLMREADVGSIPVVDSKNGHELMGIVTDRDLALKVVGQNRNLSVTMVDDIMSRDLITCSPDDDIDKVLNLMARHQIRRVPVVDETNHIVGIIAQADIALRTMDERKTAEVVEDISKSN